MTTPTTSGALLDGAEFIGAAAARGVAPVLFTSLSVDRPRVVRATLQSSSLGVHEARIDGRAVDEAVLDPGWTSYEWRLGVVTRDVTEQVRAGQGELLIEFTVGNGWWRGDLGFTQAAANYGDRIAVAAVLELELDDGTGLRESTSTNWRARASDTVANTLYQGQRIDARLRGEHHLLEVEPVEVDRSILAPRTSPEVVRQEVISPVEVTLSPSGKQLIDFGQNLVGWVRFTVQGPRNTVITVRHAEVLEDGELGTRPLRSARATDEFVLSGGFDHFEPTLTFHGFRFIEIEGWPGELDQHAISAVVVGSRLRRTGWFSCSEPLVNQLVHNSVWGQKGNFLSVPTDCPQRDERLGWTGDIAAYAPTAAFQFDVADFLGSWLEDLALETAHRPGHSVPVIVPDVLKLAADGHQVFEDLGPTAVWGDAAVWVPQALWQAYGDAEALARQWPAMELHLDSVERVLSPTGLWDTGFQFGDWLDPDAPPEDAAAAKADPSVVATACLYRSASFAAQAAQVLGKDPSRWQRLAGRTRAAFNQHYVANGRVRSDCATVYALAICFDLLDEDDRAAAGERLAELVAARDHRVTTGFAGTPYVTWALTRTGHVEHAYRLVLETGCPSWLYPVTMGATTVWERWDSMLPDGSINPGEMTSFNHYALGAVVDWLHQVVGGIRPGSPGHRTLHIEPVPGPGLDWARTTRLLPTGPVSSTWRISDGVFRLEVETPPEVPAVVVLPDGSRRPVPPGRHRFDCPAPVWAESPSPTREP